VFFLNAALGEFDATNVVPIVLSTLICLGTINGVVRATQAPRCRFASPRPALCRVCVSERRSRGGR
jgi:hypothetical protein